MEFKMADNVDYIGTDKKFTKHNCSICMEEILTTPKRLREKYVMLIKIVLKTYRACRHKTTLHIFFLHTYDTIIGWKG